MTNVARCLVARHGTPAWDAVLRGTGIVALLAIYPTTRWPDVAGLVGFFFLAVFVGGAPFGVVPAAVLAVLVGAGGADPTPPGVAPPGPGHPFPDYDKLPPS